MFGEILVDLGDDPLLDIGVKRLAQVGECARRRDHDERMNATFADDPFESRGDVCGKAVLFELVPIGLRDARTARADRCPARALPDCRP